MTHPLDNPVRAALLGPQAAFAEQVGTAVRYQPDVTPFLGLPAEPDAAAWADAATLLGPGGVGLVSVALTPPAGWETIASIPGVQYVDGGLAGKPDPEAVPLGAADVPEMLDLVARTQPGPFLPRTVELGGYLGIRMDGALVAMAGERVRPPGWAEISAVCTDAAWRGHGLAGRLIRAVAAGITARGETPFLHAAADNENALRLYRALGLVHRRDVLFSALRAPAQGGWTRHT